MKKKSIKDLVLEAIKSSEADVPVSSLCERFPDISARSIYSAIHILFNKDKVLTRKSVPSETAPSGLSFVYRFNQSAAKAKEPGKKVHRALVDPVTGEIHVLGQVIKSKTVAWAIEAARSAIVFGGDADNNVTVDSAGVIRVGAAVIDMETAIFSLSAAAARS